MNWDRSTVARIELGQRQVTAPELFVMPMLYGVPVVALLPTENVRITATVTATPAGLRGAATEQPYHGYGLQVEGLLEAVRTTFERLKPAMAAVQARLPGANFVEIAEAAEHVGDEATVKAAKRLRATAEEIATASVQLWERSLTAERDARVVAMGPVDTAKARQARRGHATRALLEELAPQIEIVRTGRGRTDGQR